MTTQLPTIDPQHAALLVMDYQPFVLGRVSEPEALLARVAAAIDVGGLYLNPPARAVVFSFDEKTQCQALDRTQPSLPMKKGRAGAMTHDYKRNGTIDLFAAMNIATGQVITDLTQAITTWAEHWNNNPTPFIWKATADYIITKVRRGRATLHPIKTQTDP